jgi:protein SCO1/2
MGRNKGLAFAFGLAGLAVAAVLAVTLLRREPFHGSVIEPPAPAQDFTLDNFDGRPFRLTDQRGKVVLLFFGYTSCPDVCPTTLAEFRQLRERLGSRAGDVVFVFVTVDPARDTPEKIGSYLTLFAPDFYGLSGPADALEPVYRAYGVYAEKQEGGSAAGYLVTHTSSVYVIDRGGNLRMTFPYGTPLEDMLADVRRLLAE